MSGNGQFPTDFKELQQFLGLASYYRRFVKNFAHKARPLYWLTEKGRRWNWTDECGEAFVRLKHALFSAPILAFPDFNHDFILDIDASTDGLGAVLSQQSAEGEKVIVYASRTLTKPECQVIHRPVPASNVVMHKSKQWQPNDVRDWCNRCEICSSRKSPIPNSCAPLQFQLAEQPMQRVAIDILGPLLETDHGK